MTPEQIKADIEKLMNDNGYYLDVAIIDQRSGLNLTQLLAEQWQYVPLVQVVKKPEAKASAPS